MSAQHTPVMHDSSDRVYAKQYGDGWVYWPLHCQTGALHAQPDTHPDAGNARGEACLDFTPDYKVMFDARGALDAPSQIPSGSTRAEDFGCGSSSRLMVAHVYRDGWHS